MFTSLQGLGWQEFLTNFLKIVGVRRKSDVFRFPFHLLPTSAEKEHIQVSLSSNHRVFQSDKRCVHSFYDPQEVTTGTHLLPYLSWTPHFGHQLVCQSKYLQANLWQSQSGERKTFLNCKIVDWVRTESMWVASTAQKQEGPFKCLFVMHIFSLCHPTSQYRAFVGTL